MARIILALVVASTPALAACGAETPSSRSETPPPSGDGPAATIYVDGGIDVTACTDYLAASRRCGGGSSRAFRGLQGAADAAGPGDVVQLREGTYRERLVPARSGTEQEPITWAAAPGESPTLTGTDEPAIFLRGRSHLVIEGLTVTDVVGWARLEDATHNTLRRNSFSNATASGTTGGIKLVRSRFNRILDNTLLDGNDDIVIQESDQNLVQGNTVRGGRHSLLSLRCGNGNVIRGNTFSNPRQKDLEIYDCEGTSDAPVELDSTRRNLVEENVIADTHPSSANYRYNAIQFGGQQGIVRKNVFRDNQGGGVNFQFYADESLYNNRNRVYSNTFYNNRCYAIVGNRGHSSVYYDNRAHGNLLYRNGDCAGGGQQVSVADPETVILEANVLATASPGFADEAAGDFHLAPGSPLIDAGAFLTTTSAGGSGASLPVRDAVWFYDGHGIPGESGDEIQLEGSSDTARVLAVDLTGNLLRLDRSLTWTAGQGVALRYGGSRPDVGAFESGITP